MAARMINTTGHHRNMFTSFSDYTNNKIVSTTVTINQLLFVNSTVLLCFLAFYSIITNRVYTIIIHYSREQNPQQEGNYVIGQLSKMQCGKISKISTQVELS